MIDTRAVEIGVNMYMDVRTLHYDEKTNTFSDDVDNIITNIYDYITPNDIYMFKNSRSPYPTAGYKVYYVFSRTEPGVMYELYQQL